MTHWSDFLSFAVLHGEAMKLTPIQIDIGQLMQAMAQAQQQARQAQGIIGGGFDPRLINGGGLRSH